MEFTAPIFETDKPTVLGRIYPYETFKLSVDKLQDLIDSKTLMGELGPQLQLTIDIKNASHLITKIWNDGDQWFGDAVTLLTPNGKVLEAILKREEKIKLAPRGSGNIDENGIVTNYEIVTFDLVVESRFEALI